jgi:hypothetical protein
VAAEVRHGGRPRDPDHVVSARRRTALAGLAVAAVYLAGAALSAHMSPLARRPLLDSFGNSLPAYRWVHPPPALASSNQPPHHAEQSFTFAGGTLRGGVVSTNDLQATLILQDGALSAPPGQLSVDVAIDPLDPAKRGAPPSGLAFDGNVYRVRGTYRPSGGPVTSLVTPADLALVYPADATFGLGSLKHVILSSTTGSDWRVLSTQDLPLSKQASAKVSAMGYFVVARTGGPATVAKGSSRIVPILVAGAVVLVILVFTSPRVIRRLRRRDDLDFS